MTHVPSILQGFVHVQGGFDLNPKFADFHSLELTYGPGLEKKIEESKSGFVPAFGAEHDFNPSGAAGFNNEKLRISSDQLIVEYQKRDTKISLKIPAS